MMKSPIFFFAGVFFVSLSAGQPKEPIEKNQKVFIQAVGCILVIDLDADTLRIRKPKYLDDGGYLIDGCKYYPNWELIEKRFNKNKIESSMFKIDSGALFFDRKLVGLPDTIKIRQIWQAVLWKKCAIVLGRTSLSDKEAQSYPPFFNSELITFTLKSMSARVRSVSFEPPAGAEIMLMDSDCGKKE